MSFNFDAGPYNQMATPAQSLGFPEKLELKDAYNLINQTPEGLTLLGVDGTFSPVTANFDSGSPHILICASTGGGKSTCARGILAPAIAKGNLGVILDVKRISHTWAYNLANDEDWPIGYADTTPMIGNALVELGREVHRRNEIIMDWVKNGGTEETAPVGERIIVVFEETNATMTQLVNLDRRLPKGAYRAQEALNDVLLLGRAAKVHMVAVMQFPDYRILSQAMVEQFNVRVMIRYTKNAWTKIAWDAGLPQAAPPEDGRGMVVYGGKARETQLLSLTNAECMAMIHSTQTAVQGNSVPMIGVGS